MATLVFRGLQGSRFNWSDGSFEPNKPVTLPEIPEEIKNVIIAEGKKKSKTKFIEVLDWTDELREQFEKKPVKEDKSKSEKKSDKKKEEVATDE